jgi:hypothetical protein
MGRQKFLAKFHLKILFAIRPLKGGLEFKRVYALWRRSPFPLPTLYYTEV